MNVPWQVQHDLIHTGEAALARTARHTARLADARLQTAPGRGHALGAALRRWMPRLIAGRRGREFLSLAGRLAAARQGGEEAQPHGARPRGGLDLVVRASRPIDRDEPGLAVLSHDDVRRARVVPVAAGRRLR